MAQELNQVSTQEQGKQLGNEQAYAAKAALEKMSIVEIVHRAVNNPDSAFARFIQTLTPSDVVDVINAQSSATTAPVIDQFENYKAAQDNKLHQAQKLEDPNEELLRQQIQQRQEEEEKARAKAEQEQKEKEAAAEDKKDNSSTPRLTPD